MIFDPSFFLLLKSKQRFARFSALCPFELNQADPPRCIKSMASSVGSGAAKKVMSVHFEVYGKVQGVFFRKYTQARAEELNLRGWIRNTSRRTVEGDIEGLSGMLNPFNSKLITYKTSFIQLG